MVSYLVLTQACTSVHTLAWSTQENDCRQVAVSWGGEGREAGSVSRMIRTPGPIPTALAITWLLRTLRNLAEGLAGGKTRE